MPRHPDIGQVPVHATGGQHPGLVHRRPLDLLARDTTTLVIAHRLSTIRQADEIVVLEQGEIVERGRHDEFLERDGLYASLWRAQNEEGGGSGASGEATI